MPFKDIFKGLFKNKNPSNNRFATMLNGGTPIFSQFGQDIYASDVVQICIDTIATECSKLQPKHIRSDGSNMQVFVKSSLNRLFKFAPNPLMTTRDFLEKIVWLLYMNLNCFIYPMYELKKNENGDWVKEYKAFYPLNPTQVDFLQDESNKLFVKFYFSNGDDFTLPYQEVIHLRKKYSVNDIMGGGLNGQPDNEALLKVLEINNTLLQGLEKAIKSSLLIRGILKINTMMDDDNQKSERAKFERAIESGSAGILPIDLKAEYIPLEIDPKLIDKNTLDFLENKILRNYGVSVAIINGDFTDEQYQAFYEKTLEPIIIALGQAFSKTIFSQRELDFGNEIVFYPKDMMYLSTKTKLELLKTAGEQGLLNDNQKLALLGYPPVEGGSRRTMSLNYIDINLINDYQMKKAGSKEKIQEEN
jgi:HK97 family phage portal protein